MSESNKELLRAAILRILANNYSTYGLDARAVGNLLPGEGFRIPDNEVVAELDLLLNWRFVRVANSPLNPTKRAFVITADGRGVI